MNKKQFEWFYWPHMKQLLDAPLLCFCRSDFGSQFIAEALLTWTMAGKEFHEIWGMICPLVNTN